MQRCRNGRTPCASCTRSVRDPFSFPSRTTDSHAANHVLPGHSRDFRDKILTRNPGLLNVLLTKATSSAHDFEEVCWLHSEAELQCPTTAVPRLQIVVVHRVLLSLSSFPPLFEPF